MSDISDRIDTYREWPAANTADSLPSLAETMPDTTEQKERS
jgi:hypothetical protein